MSKEFCIAAIDSEETILGVAIVGRPVSRRLDDGYTAEIVRTCTTGTKNVNSLLYGRLVLEFGKKWVGLKF